MKNLVSLTVTMPIAPENTMRQGSVTHQTSSCMSSLFILHTNFPVNQLNLLHASLEMLITSTPTDESAMRLRVCPCLPISNPAASERMSTMHSTVEVTRFLLPSHHWGRPNAKEKVPFLANKCWYRCRTICVLKLSKWCSCQLHASRSITLLSFVNVAASLRTCSSRKRWPSLFFLTPIRRCIHVKPFPMNDRHIS